MKLPVLEDAKRLAERAAHLVGGRVIILLYHRIAQLPTDPQLLSVSPSNFSEHLQILQRYGNPISLPKVAHFLDQRLTTSHRVVVTFDDGYADNLHNAKPLLEKYDVPATVFVASGYVGSQTGFWKDILSMILLQPTELPPILEIRLNGSGYHWELGEVARYSQERFERHRLWTILSGRDPTMRQSLYRTLCALMVRSTKWERERVLDELVSWSGLDLTVRPSWHRTLMSQEVVQLEEGGLIEVGSHTESHPILSSRTLAEQRFEIVTGKECLEELLGREVENFAYPYGGRSHYTDETVGLVREAGFKKACSNFEGVVRRRADMWQLPRFLVRNWTGEEFHERLQYWLSN